MDGRGLRGVWAGDPVYAWLPDGRFMRGRLRCWQEDGSGLLVLDGQSVEAPSSDIFPDTPATRRWVAALKVYRHALARYEACSPPGSGDLRRGAEWWALQAASGRAIEAGCDALDHLTARQRRQAPGRHTAQEDSRDLSVDHGA